MRHIVPVHRHQRDDPTAEIPDVDVIARVRAGDVESYTLLYVRHHEAAVRLARQLARQGDVDDLVAEAFSKVLAQLLAAKGPDVYFRAYLLTTLRHLHYRRSRSELKVRTTDEARYLDRSVDDPDSVLMAFETQSVRRAYDSLPERWQAVLWHMEVEKQRPSEIALLLGMTPNAVSALAVRARERLRQAYLHEHIVDGGADEECRHVIERLPSFARGKLSQRESRSLHDHLDDCARCTAAYLEVREVNSEIAGSLAVALLGVSGTGYLAAVPPSSLLLAHRPREWVQHRWHSSPLGPAQRAALVAAAGVALVAVTSLAVAATHGRGDAAAADPGLAARPTAPAPSLLVAPPEVDGDEPGPAPTPGTGRTPSSSARPSPPASPPPRPAERAPRAPRARPAAPPTAESTDGPPATSRPAPDEPAARPARPDRPSRPDRRGALAGGTRPGTVSPTPDEPTARFMVAVDGLTSSFDGSSSLTTGDATFAWDFGDGSTGSGPAPSHTYAAAGTYTVRLTVVDGGGDDTTQQDVTATVPNEPPVAGFVLGAVGPAAMLDASSSADPDGRVVSFRWDFGDGTVGTGVAPLHLFPGPGSYDVVLTVTDDDGASDTHLYTFRYRV